MSTTERNSERPFVRAGASAASSKRNRSGAVFSVVSRESGLVVNNLLLVVATLVVFFGTILKRSTPHIYVANWFYGAFIITVAILHIFNNLAVPVSLTKSYQIYTGTVDAMMQWWYGHNAVGFFLTTAFLGMMYYFVPKQAGRPVYSYRLSVVHFWSLIAVYMWAGPHHLHYTSLPDWAQTLGMVFSIVLLAPSWGGMINGIMTLSGAWHKLRSDPVLKFMIVALSFYGMSTFEGPMMSIKTVNALSHYTDWTIGHVHSGALGWVAMITSGCTLRAVSMIWSTEKPEGRWMCSRGARHCSATYSRVMATFCALGTGESSSLQVLTSNRSASSGRTMGRSDSATGTKTASTERRPPGR